MHLIENVLCTVPAPDESVRVLLWLSLPAFSTFRSRRSGYLHLNKRGLRLAGILCSSLPPLQDDRLEDDWVPTEDTRELEEIERETREREAANKAVVLEMIGDLPEADAKPPPNMLFICKLNPVTTEEVPSPATPSRFSRSFTEVHLLHDPTDASAHELWQKVLFDELSGLR